MGMSREIVTGMLLCQNKDLDSLGQFLLTMCALLILWILHLIDLDDKPSCLQFLVSILFHNEC